MSTAHRPTWAPAKGGEEQGGARWFKPSIQTSSKNAPGHTKLKFRSDFVFGFRRLCRASLECFSIFRQDGQGTAKEIGNKEDLRASLEEKERRHASKGINFEGTFKHRHGHRIA